MKYILENSHTLHYKPVHYVTQLHHIKSKVFYRYTSAQRKTQHLTPVFHPDPITPHISTSSLTHDPLHTTPPSPPPPSPHTHYLSPAADFRTSAAPSPAGNPAVDIGRNSNISDHIHTGNLALLHPSAISLVQGRHIVLRVFALVSTWHSGRDGAGAGLISVPWPGRAGPGRAWLGWFGPGPC